MVSLFDIETGTNVVLYGGARGGRIRYYTTFTPTTITIHEIKTSETDNQIKVLMSQWNRAKVQKNKNLMRDIERRIKCIRGY